MARIEENVTRRTALRLLAAALLLPLPTRRALAYPVLHGAAPRPGRKVVHPTPRPGVTAAKVLAPDRVPAHARAGYEAARAIPQVLDGLHCYCECAERDDLYSLLSCFETEMPITCVFCHQEAVTAHRLARRGKTLDQIRAAVDAELGEFAK